MSWGACSTASSRKAPRSCSSSPSWRPARATGTRSASSSRTVPRDGSASTSPPCTPLLYRLEERGWLEGRWVEKPGTRRRRFYRLTREGRKVLAAQRDNWRDFVEAVALITGVKHA